MYNVFLCDKREKEKSDKEAKDKKEQNYLNKKSIAK